jgi:hypothetical protein
LAHGGRDLLKADDVGRLFIEKFLDAGLAEGKMVFTVICLIKAHVEGHDFELGCHDDYLF